MEELFTLKDLLLKGDVSAALAIVDELEEMSRDDKISTIRSYAVVLLLHLIKQQIEQRSTRSWDISIRNCVRQIQAKNKRRKAGGTYLSLAELQTALAEALPDALDRASLEVHEGRYEPAELSEMVDQAKLLHAALTLILVDA